MQLYSRNTKGIKDTQATEEVTKTEETNKKVTQPISKEKLEVGDVVILHYVNCYPSCRPLNVEDVIAIIDDESDSHLFYVIKEAEAPSGFNDRMVLVVNCKEWYEKHDARLKAFWVFESYEENSNKLKGINILTKANSLC